MTTKENAKRMVIIRNKVIELMRELAEVYEDEKNNTGKKSILFWSDAIRNLKYAANNMSSIWDRYLSSRK